MNILKNFGLNDKPKFDKWGMNMPKLQVDLSDEEDKQLEIYKIHHNLPNKQVAMKQILRQGHRPLDIEYDPKGFEEKNE